MASKKTTKRRYVTVKTPSLIAPTILTFSYSRAGKRLSGELSLAGPHTNGRFVFDLPKSSDKETFAEVLRQLAAAVEGGALEQMAAGVAGAVEPRRSVQ